MRKGKIRTLALAIIKNKSKLLVCLGQDKKIGKKFYRLPGGEIEFGETGENALAREIKEEFNTRIKNIKYLSTLENIFNYQGKKGHEICVVYTAQLIGKKILDKKKIPVLDDRDNLGIWVSVNELRKSILYPDGAKNLL